MADDLDFGATIRGFSAGQKVFSRYVLKKILGRGGMGVVWLATDETLRRDVAIKMLPEMVSTDPAAIRDLQRETARSQELSHPYILRIYDFAEGQNVCGITMELVKGGTLTQKRLAQPNELFASEELIDWVKQLCEALEYAHRKAKIVHRDLKPANLMVDEDGDLKIADFGIAASVSDSVSRVSQQAGSSGTPLYMSPQQMMGEDPAVTDDIYALGATLFELLAGKPPFHTGNLMMQVMNKAAPDLAERRQKVAEERGVKLSETPKSWSDTINACLAKERADRPQNAGEVWARLSEEVPSLSTIASLPNLTETESEVEEARVRELTDLAKSISRKEPEPSQAPQAAAIPEEPPAVESVKTKLKTGPWVIAVLVVGVAWSGWWFGVEKPSRTRAAAAGAKREAAAWAELKLSGDYDLKLLGPNDETVVASLATAEVLVGRTFSVADLKLRSQRLAVINQDVWREMFDENSDIVGQSIEVKGVGQAVVIGVTTLNDAQLWVTDFFDGPNARNP